MTTKKGIESTRRIALKGLVAGSAILASGAHAQTTPIAALTPSTIGKHAPKALPFDANKLKGLSSKLLLSHHENNYAGAVKNLNRIEEELAKLPKDAPPPVMGALKERELSFTGSMVLHELYFENLGGDGKAGASLEKRIGDAHGSGSFAAFEQTFRATASSLGGGSGWVLLAMHLHTGELRTYWSGNHTQAPALAAPLLVLDMYEHAYAIDYGAAAAKYIDAFFQNVRWDVVDKRLDRALRARAALVAVA
jgi:superoxide dismutase, Fe-Mn family